MDSPQVRGILADVNAVQEVELLTRCLLEWKDLVPSMPSFRLSDWGLPDSTDDATIWRLCQSQRLLFFTNNRNHDGPTSLEEAIRTLNDSSCLPVFTFASWRKFRSDISYAQRATEDLVEYLIEIENHLGTGRLYLPKGGH